MSKAASIPSVSGLGDRYYETAADLTREVGDARIWGGIHFRSAVTDGTEIGRQTADYILSHHFRKVAN
ncbi:MAG TPA: hypothetical protein VJB57_14085 [Dehalococcoidia bacterium]|nr:hypothetical protein [Dehalococcoidia bacterium]